MKQDDLDYIIEIIIVTVLLIVAMVMYWGEPEHFIQAVIGLVLGGFVADLVIRSWN